ncbi:MAG TPA: hypothetical protein VM369_01870 [Candidatus Binatia bacterium]|nr:hypothetical protein [Candidatus Binatia bacterium]
MRLQTFAFAVAALTAAATVTAATPESGTITDEQTTAEFSGGPFIVPNQTNIIQLDDLAGDPIPVNSVCESDTGMTCDEYRFEVKVSSPNPEDDAIVVRVGWDNSVTADDGVPPDANVSIPDYDLELYNDETGDFVAQQATGDNPEVMTIPAVNGKYRLVLVPYNAGNTPYTGKVSFEKFEEERGVLGSAGAFTGVLLPLLGLAGLLGRARRRR